MQGTSFIDLLTVGSLNVQRCVCGVRGSHPLAGPEYRMTLEGYENFRLALATAGRLPEGWICVPNVCLVLEVVEGSSFYAGA